VDTFPGCVLIDGAWPKQSRKETRKKSTARERSHAGRTVVILERLSEKFIQTVFVAWFVSKEIIVKRGRNGVRVKNEWLLPALNLPSKRIVF
jgi:ribosomal protein S25